MSPAGQLKWLLAEGAGMYEAMTNVSIPALMSNEFYMQPVPIGIVRLVSVEPARTWKMVESVTLNLPKVCVC